MASRPFRRQSRRPAIAVGGGARLRELIPKPRETCGSIRLFQTIKTRNAGPVSAIERGTTVTGRDIPPSQYGFAQSVDSARTRVKHENAPA